MARGDSIIKVSIIGDVTKLIGALNTADQKTGGLLKSTAKVAGSLFLAQQGVQAGFDFVNSSLDNADKFADAIDRIAGATDPAFAQRIADISGDFTNIGLSSVEFADLAARFTDFAIAAKVSQPAIQKMVPDLLTIASAISATTGKPLDEVITDIGKAAQGNQKPVSEYGVVVDKALNPDERLTDILDQLNKKFPDAITAANDLAGAQDTLNAKWETFTQKFGTAIEPALKGIVDFINDEIDAIPHAIKGFEMLGSAVEGFGRTALGPLGNVRDALEGILNLVGQAGNALGGRGSFDETAITRANRNYAERNGLTGP